MDPASPFLLVAALAQTDVAVEVDYRRDVLPILTQHCFTCHGPDAQTREGDLRLDQREELFKPLRPQLWVVQPGDPARSELWYRVSTDDEYEVMPPFWSEQPRLSEAEQAVLLRWIEADAPWSEHWAYSPPDPALGSADLDDLVREALERDGLSPAPQAPEAKLIRRLSLDLTGLPPSVAEVDAFLADGRPEAYGRLVDRLLDSPHYGEARARRWLDLARYADTNGYEKDERRTHWRYRDWVIDAFNADLPFDRFTVEQLAGDLLPEPTLEQRVATGFHRNTMINNEGGTDAEEFRVAAVLDRVNTTAAVWLGTTLACAQCHDHKYDPFSQREYYGLFAFFNSTTDTGNSLVPTLKAPDAEERGREAELVERLEAHRLWLEQPDAVRDGQQQAWEARVRPQVAPPVRWSSLDPVAEGRSTRTGASLADDGDGGLVVADQASGEEGYEFVLSPGELERLTALRLEARTQDHVEGARPVGRARDGNFVLTDVALERLPGGDPARAEPLELSGAWADFEQAGGEFPVLHAVDDDPRSGWAVAPEQQRDHRAIFALARPAELAPGDLLRARLEHGYGGGFALRRFRLSGSADDDARGRVLLPAFGPWRSVGPFRAPRPEALFDEDLEPEREALEGRSPSAAYGEAGAWTERPDWIDARVHRIEGSGPPYAFVLARTVVSDTACELDLVLGSDDAIRVLVNGAEVHANPARRGAARAQDRVRVALEAGEKQLLIKIVNYGGVAGFAFEAQPPPPEAWPDAARASLHTPPAARDADQTVALRRHYRASAHPEGPEREKAAEADAAALDTLRAAFPSTLVLAERDEPRPTHLLERGSFLSPGEAVEPHVPAALHPMPEDAPRNRLGLARWLVSPDNPLTARVVVNRAWEDLFGVGLVATSDDFGTRGDLPNHPRILDALARGFVEEGWSVKSLYRRLVTSELYRRDSARPADGSQPSTPGVDLTRAPRFRLPAETVRDNALAIAGLLDRELGGPSVFPPQPEGIWAATYNSDAWRTDRGPARYRRGLYTFLRRTAPYPTFLMFDATSREVTCTRRARTNTPLQALAVLNDPAFVEAAGGLAARMLAEGGTGDRERLAHGMRWCGARRPAVEEVDILTQLLGAERERYRADPEAAQRLVAAAGPEAQAPAEASELAPWIVVANALLNLDETLSKD